MFKWLRLVIILFFHFLTKTVKFVILSTKVIHFFDKFVSLQILSHYYLLFYLFCNCIHSPEFGLILETL